MADDMNKMWFEAMGDLASKAVFCNGIIIQCCLPHEDVEAEYANTFVTVCRECRNSCPVTF